MVKLRGDVCCDVAFGIIVLTKRGKSLGRLSSYMAWNVRGEGRDVAVENHPLFPVISLSYRARHEDEISVVASPSILCRAGVFNGKRGQSTRTRVSWRGARGAGRPEGRLAMTRALGTDTLTSQLNWNLSAGFG